MIATDQIAEYLRQCAAEVFGSMLGMEAEAGSVRVEQAPPAVNDGVFAFVGMAGAWAGTGAISCSSCFARRMCGAMLLSEPDSVDDDVLDAVAEVANMIVGNFKNKAEEHLGPLGLSIPTVIYGHNFASCAIGGAEWVVVPFHSEGEVLEVRVCLAPSEQSSQKSADGSFLMIRTEKVVEYVRNATESVFTTMLDMEVQASPQHMDSQSPASSGGVLSFVGMAGAWAGTGVISCSTDFARRVCAALLMTEADSVNEEVLDAMGELTNMIIGNFKNMAEEHLGPMGLSIPTVIYGRNFTSRSAAREDWVVVPFTSGEEKLEIRICLAPSRDKETPRNGYTQPATLLN